jgi:hypothetical protein
MGGFERRSVALLISTVLFALFWGNRVVLAQGTVAVTVDLEAGDRDISPAIYGVSFAGADQLASVPYPANRWGGNSVTRYNWRADVSNRASDWFFMNIPEASVDPDLLPDGSTADVFVAESLAGGATPLMTLPLIGWTPLGVREKKWGFSVAMYGAQDETECTATGGAFWCEPDAGNGYASGVKLTGNNPADTSMPIDETWVTDWVNHLGTSVRWFALDNEPMLWSETHFDVHPSPLNYDEIWARTAVIGSAVKTVRPDATIFGPVVWGWCAYFFSAADGCSPGADQGAHGGQPFLEWYLDQICEHEANTGVRPVDVLDVHYYPQGGQALTGEGGSGLQALRLRSVKDLYDPSYASESWIGQPVRLIPRMRELIDQRCPGLGLAVTEYNWGQDGISSALAQAEVLAVFGREGVSAAMRWVAPDTGTRMEDAFRLFLDYDGAGSHVTGTSRSCVSSDVDRVGAYAVESPTGSLLVLLFNKSTSAEDVHVTVEQPVTGTASTYRFTDALPLGSAGSVDMVSGTADLLLPARSATVMVLAGATDRVFADGFESTGTGAWSSIVGG